MSELSDWMRKHSVAQKMRNLVEEMEIGQIYEPLSGLVTKGKAQVEITVDDVRAYWKRIKRSPRKRSKPKPVESDVGGDTQSTESST